MGTTGVISPCPQDPRLMVRFNLHEEKGYYSEDGGNLWYKLPYLDAMEEEVQLLYLEMKNSEFSILIHKDKELIIVTTMEEHGKEVRD